MVQNLGDNEPWDTHAGHMTGGRAAQIMRDKGDIRHGHDVQNWLPYIDNRLGEASGTGEHPWSLSPRARQRPYNVLRRSTEGHTLGEPILRDRCWDSPPSCLQVNSVPTHGPHFSTTLGGEEMQFAIRL